MTINNDNFVKSENGATAIEYALIATGISIAIIGAVFAFGDEVVLLYDWLENALSGGE